MWHTVAQVWGSMQYPIARFWPLAFLLRYHQFTWTEGRSWPCGSGGWRLKDTLRCVRGTCPLLAV